MPNKALSLFLCLSFFSEKGFLTPMGGQNGLCSLWPPWTPLCSYIFGVPGPTFPTLTCSVRGCHSNQQNSKAELPFAKLKVAGLHTSTFDCKWSSIGPPGPFPLGWLPPQTFAFLPHSSPRAWEGGYRVEAVREERLWEHCLCPLSVFQTVAETD